MKWYKDPTAGIHRAIKYFGSQRAYARALHVVYQEISKWLRQLAPMPLKYAISTECLTQGVIPAETLPIQDPSLLRSYKHCIQQRVISQKAGLTTVRLPVFSIDATYWPQTEQPMDICALPHPILIDEAHRLIFGIQRLRWREAQGQVDIAARVIDTEACLAGHEQQMAACKQLLLIEQMAIGFILEQQLGNRQGRHYDAHRRNCAYERGKTVAIVSKSVGMGSADSYRRAKYVMRHGISALVVCMGVGALSPSAAYQIARQPQSAQAQLVSCACKQTASSLFSAVSTDVMRTTLADPLSSPRKATLLAQE